MTPAKTGNRRITITDYTAQLISTFKTENLARSSYSVAAIMKASERFPILVRAFDHSHFFDKTASRALVEKLRFSREFGTQVELREGNQALQVHVIKQDMHPILISPYFKKETHQLAKKYHIELVPTWLLGKLAGENIGKKLDMKKLFKTYMKEGTDNMQTFLTRTFKKK